MGSETAIQDARQAHRGLSSTPGCVGSVLELMCHSPLVALRGRRVSHPRAQLWAKLELALPGAMKDRVALSMVEDAEDRGLLAPGGTIVESSSGTLAEGLARVGAVKGYRVIIVTDPRIDPMTLAKLRALGSEVHVVEHYHPQGGWQRSRLEALHDLLQKHPEAYWTRQYDNPANAAAYEEPMVDELVTALGDGLGAVVASVGSGGSLCGTARGLKKHLPKVKIVAVDAVGSLLFHQPDRRRLQSGHGNSIIASNLDYTVIDEAHWIADGEAFNACRELASREGIFGGGSSGAVYVAASWVAQGFAPEQHVVAILPDRGDRYFPTVYSDEFLVEHGLVGLEAGAEPKRIAYGKEVAERWSWAELPHDGSVPYHAPEAGLTRDLVREMGLG